jgi:putative metallohydrolase (TIGR04338 family)
VKDFLTSLQKTFDRQGPRMVTGVPAATPVRYERTTDGVPVYAAQKHLMAILPHRTLVGSEIQDYADEVLAMPWPRWWTGPLPGVLIRVHPVRYAAYVSGVIHVPDVVGELVLLHELAHHLAGPLNEHDTGFVQAYLDLVEHVMNPAARARFIECLAAEGVSA